MMFVTLPYPPRACLYFILKTARNPRLDFNPSGHTSIMLLLCESYIRFKLKHFFYTLSHHYIYLYVIQRSIPIIKDTRLYFYKRNITIF